MTSSMSAKELYSLAASAVGLVMPAYGFVDDHGVVIGSERDGPIYWSPLTNNGHAFDLAVDLMLEIYHGDDEGLAVYAGYSAPFGSRIVYCIEYYDDLPHQGDARSATRRAIVRAAAEIAKVNRRPHEHLHD